MSAVITLASLAATTPDGRPLFESLNLALSTERTGVVGRNGAGKSTLLNIIAGTTEPASGTAIRTGSIGVLHQLAPTGSIQSALNLTEQLAILTRIETGQATPTCLDTADWTLPTRLEAALAQIGLPSLDLTRDMSTLSGGERTRISLARLLLEQPDLLVLDEPTNNLDADGRAAIADLLKTWRGGAVIASHDRDLLEHVDRIVELTPIGITIFGGGWTTYATAREADRLRAEADLNRATNLKRQTERDIQQQRERKARREQSGKKLRASGSLSKLTLDKMKDSAEQTASRDAGLANRQLTTASDDLATARARVEITTPLNIDLPKSGLPNARVLLELTNIEMQIGNRHLFGPLTFDLRGPQRIAIKGANGSGKTTLLKLIIGQATPTRGTVCCLTTRIAMLDQHLAILDPALSPLENLLEQTPNLTEHEARTHLARFAFRNDRALQTTATLSGGERMRAGLACAFAGNEPPELLILDEPTNHLDITATEELESTLNTYDGAILVISHDQKLLDAINVESEIQL